ncbi:hypothetical protein [Thermomonospora umbrina]|uniref:Uncharacterized protein n=1 Tax=Thermomonospora umbrina TaxID=111806 RepID=A0A3D9SWR6_9ACTN|nr:hypothetical protein [Thermomonospora umbrina]REE97445.1 hypothetical protein DFJ69_2917 [Thermomonospora umbrina]
MTTPSGTEQPVPKPPEAVAGAAHDAADDEPVPPVPSEGGRGMTGNTSHRPEEFNPDDFE